MGGKTIQERIADVIAKTCTDYVDAYRMDEKTAQILTRVLKAEFGARRAYNPATHIVVSREAGGECLNRLEAAGLVYGGHPDGVAALAEIRAAMEVGE